MKLQNWKLQTCIGTPVYIEFRNGEPKAYFQGKFPHETNDPRSKLSRTIFAAACRDLGPCEWVYVGMVEVMEIAA